MPLGATTSETASPEDSLLGAISDNPNFIDYAYARPRIQRIIDDWAPMKKETDRLRALRYIRVDREGLKADNRLKTDETYVAIRLIDQNIRAEITQDIAYLTQSRRSLIFKAVFGQVVNDLEKLELNFTDVARYIGWEKPFLKAMDGSKHHGWDSIEVILDIANPGHFGLEQIGHENLLFDLDAEDIQNQELLLRVVKFTAIQLRQNVKDFGFNPEEVDRLINNNSKTDKILRDVVIDIYKCFYKNLEDGLVYVGWFGEKLNDWLKAPTPLFIGRRDNAQGQIEKQADGSADFPKIYETSYPIYILAYAESEDQKILSIRGRGFLDEPAQEAASAIESGIVNGTMRASNMYASAVVNPNSLDSSPPKEVPGLVLKNGIVYDKPVEFSHTEYPPPAAIQALQTIIGYNKLETSKVDLATENRKDSRKTATEVQAANMEASRLTAVQIVLLSIFIRQVYGRCWELYKNRVLCGKIKILDQELQSLFSYDYDLKASGDVDVIQRQEKMQRQMTAWPVISQTTIASEFLKDIVRAAFPEEAERYIAKLEQTSADSLIASLASIVQALIIDPKTGQLQSFAQPYATQLQNLSAEVQGYFQQQQKATGASQNSQISKPQQSIPRNPQTQANNGQQQVNKGLQTPNPQPLASS